MCAASVTASIRQISLCVAIAGGMVGRRTVRGQTPRTRPTRLQPNDLTSTGTNTPTLPVVRASGKTAPRKGRRRSSTSDVCVCVTSPPTEPSETNEAAASPSRQTGASILFLRRQPTEVRPTKQFTNAYYPGVRSVAAIFELFDAF